MEKNIKKNVYKSITESLCCTVEISIVNQLYFNKKIKDKAAVMLWEVS